jgi:hypothetical protein
MSEEEKPKEKRGLFQRLFSDSGKDPKKKQSMDDSRLADKRKNLQRRQTVAEATFHQPRTEFSTERKFSQAGMPLTKAQQQQRAKAAAQKGGGQKAGGPPKKKQPAKPAKPASTSSSGATGKRKKKKEKGHVNVDVTKPLDWPCTPETLLEYHKKKPILSSNEEWIVVELNEFECLIESNDIIKKIAKHSKFFELDPDELWEEFFEFVEEVPSYDDIINYDVWQEFRDKRYPC